MDGGELKFIVSYLIFYLSLLMLIGMGMFLDFVPLGLSLTPAVAPVGILEDMATALTIAAAPLTLMFTLLFTPVTAYQFLGSIIFIYTSGIFLILISIIRDWLDLLPFT